MLSPSHGEPLRNAINVAFLRVCAGIGSNGSARYSSAFASRIRDDNACFEQFRETWIQRSDNRGEEYVSVELAESREGKFVLNDRNIPLRNGISNFLLSISVEIADSIRRIVKRKEFSKKGRYDFPMLPSPHRRLPLDVGRSPGQLYACKNRELIDESVWSRIQREARELMLLWTRIRFCSNPPFRPSPTNPGRGGGKPLAYRLSVLKRNRNSEKKGETIVGGRRSV